MEKTLVQNESYKKAVKLHSEIMVNAETAAYSLVEMCKGLKQMRDEELYSQFNFADFDAYCEEMVGIKARQAYNYISTYEKLGSTVLQSNAKLGITKLELISQLPPVERTERLADGELEGMSVKEIKELVRTSKEQADQLDFFKTRVDEMANELQDASEEKNKQEDRLNDLAEELQAAKAELAELEAKPVEVAVQEVDPAEKERLAAEIRKEVQKELKGKQKETIDREVRKAVEKAEKEAAEKARKEALEKQEEKIRQLEQAVEDSENTARELEKKLKTSDGHSTTAKLYFEAMKDSYQKMVGALEEMEPEYRTKFTEAIKKALTIFLQNLEG